MRRAAPRPPPLEGHPARSTRIALAALAVGALSLTSLPITAATAATTGAPLIASLSTTRDPAYSQNQPRFGDTGMVQTDGQGGFIAYSSGWNMTIAPPDGQVLHPGVYSDVDSGARTSQHAYADIAVGSFDLGFSGTIDVLDWTADSRGVPTRFDVVFRDPGLGSANGEFGELRMGEDTDAMHLAATHLEWSPTPVASVPITALEWLHNTSSAAVRVGTAALGGDAKADWTLTADGCSGRTLGAGARCSMTVGFSPKQGGPRVAALSIPIGSSVRTVSLSGDAPLGTTRLTTSGQDFIDQGTTHVWADGGFTQLGTWKGGCGEWFGNIESYGKDDGTNDFMFELAGPDAGPVTVGTHQTGDCDYGSGTSTLIPTGLGHGFSDSVGTETVHRYDVAADGSPTVVDVTFSVHDEFDPTHPMTGTLLYRFRSDTTAPAAPTAVRVATSGSARVITWTRSSSADAVKSIARLVEGSGSGATATSGLPIAAGTGTTATLPALRAGRAYTVVVFAVDASGNTSAAGHLAVTG